MLVKLLKAWMQHQPGAVLDLDESIAKAVIANGTAEEVKNSIQAEIEKAAGGMLESLTKSFNEQIDAVLKDFAQEFQKSNKNRVPAIFGEGQKGDPEKTFGKFLLAVRRGDTKTLEEMGSKFNEWGAETKAALTGQEGGLGGYTIPDQFHNEVMKVVVENSIVRKRASKIPMAHRTVEVPILDVFNTPSAGDTAFLGGVVARWTEEAASRTETEPAFKQMKMEAHELSGYSKVSNTLLADSAVGLESMLKMLFGKAIAWTEDYAFLRGDGVGKPLGILNSNALLSVSRSAASAFALGDAAKMFSRLLPSHNQSTTAWIMHPYLVEKLITMEDSNNVVYIDSARDKVQRMLLGYPVETTEKLPALNTVGDVMLVDFQYYLIGERQQIEIAFSEHVAFLNNQGVWRFVSRCDGQPWMRDTITLADGTSTVSPFIALAAG